MKAEINYGPDDGVQKLLGRKKKEKYTSVKSSYLMYDNNHMERRGEKKTETNKMHLSFVTIYT